MKQRLVAATSLGIMLACLLTPPALGDGLVLNTVKAEASVDDTGYSVEVPILNTGEGKVILDSTLALAESPASCTATVDQPTVLGLQPTTVKLAFGKECFGDGDSLKVDLDNSGPLAAVTITKPKDEKHVWWPFWVAAGAAILGGVATILLGRRKISAVDTERRKYNSPGTDREHREKVYDALKERVQSRFDELDNKETLRWKNAYEDHQDKARDRAWKRMVTEVKRVLSHQPKSSPTLGAIEIPAYTWNSEVAGLEAGWSFKDSWAANLTVATTAFVALFSSADTLAAVIGGKHDTALAMMTVAGLISAVIVAVATTVAKLVGEDPAKVTAGGLVVSTSMVVAAAALQTVAVGVTASTLTSGIVADGIAWAITVAVLFVLLWYARESLDAALGKASTVDPVLIVPPDAFDAWKVEFPWQMDVVKDRIKATYADYLSTDEPMTASSTPMTAYIVTPAASVLGRERIRASII